MGKADLHIHTTYSYDGSTSVRDTLKYASEAGLDVIAITDHDTVYGSFAGRELASQYGLEVIPGLEVSTKEGHLLALYVEKNIPPKRPLIETLQRIDDLGGIAIAPHPANRLPASLSLNAIMASLVNELIETYC
ncbi:MAG: hypothetical protein Kow002_19820 [Anaerolineales bacterium]